VQNLSLPLLEEIRILSDLEAGRKLLQVVLVGQPEFDEQLRLPRMRQIHQRVSVHCQLQSLDRDNVTGYVLHRLRTAGATTEQVRLLPEALDLVHAASGGVPRVINLLCDKALARGEARRTSRIDADLVREAMADLRMPALVAPPAVVSPDTAPAALANAAGKEQTAVAASPRVRQSSTNSLARGKVWRGTSSLRPAAAAALMVLGVTTGVSLVSYWVWVRPIWISTIVLPSVGPPAHEVVAIGPLVLRPAPRRTGTAGTLVDPPEAVEPSQPVAAAASSDLVWTIQAGIFSDPARAASVVARLEQLNYPSFERELGFGGEARFRVAFAGPYGSREAAAAALEALQRTPGFEGALVRPLTP
jgi:cell division septation protein DedD